MDSKWHLWSYLDIEDGLKRANNGNFGSDTVGLGIQNSNGPTLTNQVVAGIATKDYYLVSDQNLRISLASMIPFHAI